MARVRSCTYLARWKQQALRVDAGVAPGRASLIPNTGTKGIRMKRIALVAALLGATIFALAGNAVAAPTPIPCTSSMAGTVINKNIDVPAGTTCDLSWATINGNVTVEGALTTYGITTFNGNVTVNGGSFAAANWGVTINGNLSFLN